MRIGEFGVDAVRLKKADDDFGFGEALKFLDFFQWRVTPS